MSSLCQAHPFTAVGSSVYHFLIPFVSFGKLSASISAPLKDKIRTEAPDEAIDIPVAAFYDVANLTPGELYALWQDGTEIYNEAAEAEEHGQDKNAWGSGEIRQSSEEGSGAIRFFK